MNKDFFRGRRRALLALLGAGLPAALQRALAQGSAAQGVRSVQGEVMVNGKLAEPGTLVRPGDAVATGGGALAVFVVGQDAFLMRENSRAAFAGGETLASVLRLFTGKLLGVFGPGGDRNIVTSTATVGIRGTGGYFEAEPARTDFCLCYGTADLAAAGSDQRATYITTHHESPRYIYGDGRSRAIIPANVINHTDAELIMLEGLLGRTPPRSFMNSPYMNNPYMN